MFSFLTRGAKIVVISVLAVLLIGVALGNFSGWTARSQATDVETAHNELVTEVGKKADEDKVTRSFSDLETKIGRDYLKKTDAANTYLAKTDAANTYLAKTDAANTYLAKTDAADTYLAKTDAADTYLAKTDAADTYATKSGVYARVEAERKFATYGWVKKQGFALKADVPAPVDLSGYALTSDVPEPTDLTGIEERLDRLEAADEPAPACQAGCKVQVDVQ